GCRKVRAKASAPIWMTKFRSRDHANAASRALAPVGARGWLDKRAFNRATVAARLASAGAPL
ncbi:MAG: hypothetical protein NWR52_08860, partial [Paracoccaceae bacterium]|nr:hypothetical protein [Paracoccaceae bacterium]